MEAIVIHADKDEFISKTKDAKSFDKLMARAEKSKLTCSNKSNDMISKRKVLEALEHERECLLALKMYGAEDVLVHHAIRVIEEL